MFSVRLIKSFNRTTFIRSLGQFRTPVSYQGGDESTTKWSHNDSPIKRTICSVPINYRPNIGIPANTSEILRTSLNNRSWFNITPMTQTGLSRVNCRNFHAAGSKVHYLDFRYRFRCNNKYRHLLIIRRKKMKKHKLQKFRKKFKALLAKKHLKKEIAKEKAFRVELLTIIRRAESFSPEEYALSKILERNNKPKVVSREEWFENIKELVRKNRYQVQYVKPKHRVENI